jgi:hypothetical protein
MQDGWNLDELDSLLQLRRLDMIKLEKAAHCGVESLLKKIKSISKICVYGAVSLHMNHMMKRILVGLRIYLSS